MTRYLDTTFLIDLLRGIPAAVQKSHRFKDAGEVLAVPAPCIAELVRGLAGTSRRSRGAAEALLAQLDVGPLDSAAARRAGTVAAETARRGDEVSMVDCLVAGVVLEGDGTLVTRDADFGRMPGLSVETY